MCMCICVLYVCMFLVFILFVYCIHISLKHALQILVHLLWHRLEKFLSRLEQNEVSQSRLLRVLGKGSKGWCCVGVCGLGSEARVCCFWWRWSGVVGAMRASMERECVWVCDDLWHLACIGRSDATCTVAEHVTVYATVSFDEKQSKYTRWRRWLQVGGILCVRCGNYVLFCVWDDVGHDMSQRLVVCMYILVVAFCVSSMCEIHCFLWRCLRQHLTVHMYRRETCMCILSCTCTAYTYKVISIGHTWMLLEI